MVAGKVARSSLSASLTTTPTRSGILSRRLLRLKFRICRTKSRARSLAFMICWTSSRPVQSVGIDW